MTRSDMQNRIRALRQELEDRHKFATVKMASQDGTPLATDKLQGELYSLIYKLSKIDQVDS
jgi:hypothetical protein